MLIRLVLGIVVGVVQLGIAVVPIARAQCPPGAQSCPNPSASANSQGTAIKLPEQLPGLPAAHDPAFPRPWKTAVRIRIPGPGQTQNIGSGTIVASSDSGTVALTCAHIFGRSRPSERIEAIVETFDANLQTTGSLSFVAHAATYPGHSLDFDPTRDVGLVVFQPPSPIPASPVVLSGYRIQRGEKLNTVGCSSGKDASIWTTVCVAESVRVKSAEYRGFECRFAPPQGRSGGGCFTLEGRVAGVCDFADGSAGTGIYAAPESIHKILDRNQLLETAQTGGVSVTVGNRPSVAASPPATPSPQSDGPALPPIPPSPYVPSGDASRVGADLVDLVTHPRTLGIAGLGAAAYAVARSRGPKLIPGQLTELTTQLQPIVQAPSAGVSASLDTPPSPLSIDAEIDRASKLLEQLVAMRHLQQLEAARRAEQADRLRSFFPGTTGVAPPAPSATATAAVA